MKKTSLLSVLLLSSTFLCPFNVQAEQTKAYTWQDLQYSVQQEGWSNQITLDPSFRFGDNGVWRIAQFDTVTEWSLDGNGVVMDANYKNYGFDISNDDKIKSFVFKNFNIQHFENANSGSAGAFLNNKSGNGEVLNSVFTANGTKNGIGGGVIYNGEMGSFSKINDNEFNKNYTNDVSGGGAAIYNAGKIEEISDNTFKNNISVDDNGSAIYNNGTIVSIKNNQFNNNGFALNSGSEEFASVGGAIYNAAGGVIEYIDGTFTDNKAKYAGAAIFNDGEIKELSGTYSGNYTGSEGGGAIKNNGTINKISKAVFENNKTDSNLDASALDSKGAAIYNNVSPHTSFRGKIDEISESEFYGNISADFGGALANNADITTIDNVIFGAEGKGNRGASGGAINNQEGGTIGTISNSVFAYNTALETTDFIQGNGGAIRNFEDAVITKIENTTFSNNQAGGLKEEYVDESKTMQTLGGAIFNAAGAKIDTIDNVTFADNMAGTVMSNIGEDIKVEAQGGALYTGEWDSKVSSIGEILNSTFVRNSVQGTQTLGGAIFNNGDLGKIVNTSFKNNFAEASTEAKGGAIYSTQSLEIQADSGSSIFEGNYVKVGEDKTSNSIYMAGADDHIIDLNLSAKGENGIIRFDDGIDGQSYNINLNGDGNGVVRFNSSIKNAGNLTFGSTAHMQMGLNSEINVQSMSHAVTGTRSVTDPTLTVDIEVDRANNKVNSGLINVAGDITGKYNVIVNALNPDVLDNLDDAVVTFLTAPEDDLTTDSSFTVGRVIGSPYLWKGSIEHIDTRGSDWMLNLTDEENPDFVIPDEPVDPVDPSDNTRETYAEVIAAAGLHQAAIEQTRSVVRHVSNKAALTKEYCPNCGLYDYGYDGKKLKNVWVDVHGEKANFDKNVDMDVNIWGIEAGFDLQNDINNTLGFFTSYRKGDYDLSGKGNRVYSSVGSEIDIDSYLAGLYYRYDKNMNWVFATVYGGIQKADVNVDDHLAKFDTDATEFGASVEVGHTYALSKDWTLSPSAGISYTQINYDGAHDNVGKSYKWDDVKFIEAELGARLEKQFDDAKVYVKPSVIQTFTDGDSVRISGINDKLDTYKDQTLGRVEIGGRYGFDDNLSGYVWANYTFGSSYDATAGGFGFSYSW